MSAADAVFGEQRPFELLHFGNVFGLDHFQRAKGDRQEHADILRLAVDIRPARFEAGRLAEE